MQDEIKPDPVQTQKFIEAVNAQIELVKKEHDVQKDRLQPSS